jgi:quercetin dioxygenase-like cupin family protein
MSQAEPARRSEPLDEGGDPACWAHLLEDDGVVAADLAPLLQAEGDGVHWTLEPDADLNVNLVRLGAGHSMAEHRNDEVDVLIVALTGDGHVVVDTRTIAVAAHVVVHLPKGTTRSLHAGPDGLTYLTVHRRRAGLGITAR